GLHHLRQPEHHGRRRYRSWCCLRGNLYCRSAGLFADGPLRQLARWPGARHGPERVLYLHRGRDHGLQLANGAGRGVHLGADLHGPDPVAHS
nr:hypothetical protein [Tanacetum cinerariifolium]